MQITITKWLNLVADSSTSGDPKLGAFDRIMAARDGQLSAFDCAVFERLGLGMQEKVFERWADDWPTARKVARRAKKRLVLATWEEGWVLGRGGRLLAEQVSSCRGAMWVADALVVPAKVWMHGTEHESTERPTTVRAWNDAWGLSTRTDAASERRNR